MSLHERNINCTHNLAGSAIDHKLTSSCSKAQHFSSHRSVLRCDEFEASDLTPSATSIKQYLNITPRLGRDIPDPNNFIIAYVMVL